MKTCLCFMLTFFGISIVVDAQNTLPSSGPSFSITDTSQNSDPLTASVDVRSLNFSPGSMGGAGFIQSKPYKKKVAFEPDPISDWSIPPGFMGYEKGDIIMNQKKSLSAKKYQRMKKGRCHYF